MDHAGWKNDGRIKLMIIAGTRPELIRLSEIIKKARKYLDTIVVHTGQNDDYYLREIFYADLDLAGPEIQLNTRGADLGETLGNILRETYQVMTGLRPDAVLVLGDTNSCLSSICAKRLHIPVFHMEAGNRSRDECLPEETNRRIVDTVSDVNLAYSGQAAANLAAGGSPPERIFTVGSPMTEVLMKHRDRIFDNCGILKTLGLKKKGYILLSAHREENLDTEKNSARLFHAVNRLAEEYDLPILYSCHPRAEKRILESGLTLDKRIIRHKPLGFCDYNTLQLNAFCVVSDSGTLPEESAFFASQGHPFPAVSIRLSTERQEAMEKGCFVLSGIDARGLLQAVDLSVRLVRDKGSSGIGEVPAYQDRCVSDKVIRIIQSYTGAVDQMVWRKGS